MTPEYMYQVLEHQKRHWPGIYRGIVTDNADPTSMGRLKVKIPSISDSLELWAMPCVPYAGDQVGFFSLPEPGTNCWLMFEAADISYPVSKYRDSAGATVNCRVPERPTPSSGRRDLDRPDR